MGIGSGKAWNGEAFGPMDNAFSQPRPYSRVTSIRPPTFFKKGVHE